MRGAEGIVDVEFREAGELLGISLVDHVVWTRHGGYYSFAEHGEV